MSVETDDTIRSNIEAEYEIESHDRTTSGFPFNDGTMSTCHTSCTEPISGDR